MNIAEGNKAANAIGGKTARACDSCLIKRARWFCAADDAFLCQSCDSAVHSVNQLANRHERVRLGTAALKGGGDTNSFASPPPSWHQGFTRKARTPRPSKAARLTAPAVVPEINAAGEDQFPEDINEEQLLYSVPVFDPLSEVFWGEGMVKGEGLERGDDDDDDELNLADLLRNCDNELADFAADVEGLLGIDDEEIGVGFLEGKRSVKVEDEDGDEVEAVIACHFDPALDMDMELNLDFDYGDETKTVAAVETTSEGGSGESGGEKRRMLRLNYEAVMAAWASQGSPWTDGIRPQFNLDEFMVACFEGGSNPNADQLRGRSGADDAGREARVLRYREKRRTRLFSKKIRYQVRKLNAEKRPRMKGRFVKRTTAFSGSSLPDLINNN